MDAPTFEKVRSILLRLVAVPEEEREGLLHRLTADDPNLRTSIRDLLRFDVEDVALDSGLTEASQPTEAPEAQIGPYRLIREVGEGGMGVVYLAEQQAPIRRHVALKVVKLGMDTREVVARFEAEREALALMDHPAIATVFDAGNTPEGRPYFAMEFVRGTPVTEFCDDRRLPLNDRLRLFGEICSGVQHAHHKGVVHRDLKPSNILVQEVDGRPHVKIIDFGVAKALAGPIADRTAVTVAGMLIGTPEYMSPEQASLNRDIDTRSDVYSLGVILYELLVGALPNDRANLNALPFDEAIRRIREQEAPSPSVRLGALGASAQDNARKRSTDLRTLHRELRGDLDWIVRKALEKDRNRRYDSVKELEQDLARRLAHEPVSAGPPSRRYRSGKFIRRNRSAVVLLGVLLGSLLALALIMTIQTRLTASARDLAMAERDRAEAAHLATLAEHEPVPSKSLAYALASLELSDQEHVRRLAIQKLDQAPPYFNFFKPAYPKERIWNPWVASISPDARWVAIGYSQGGYIAIIPQPSGEVIDLWGHQSWVTWIEFTDDSQHLITASADGTVRCWSVGDWWEERSLEIGPSIGIVFRVLRRGDEVILWSVDPDQSVRMLRWNYVTGQHAVIGDEPSPGTLAELSALDVTLDGRWIARSRGRDVYLVPLEAPMLEGTRIGSHADSIVAVGFSPDGTLLATTALDNTVHVRPIDPDRADQFRSFHTIGSATTVGISGDNRYVWVGTTDNGVELFDLKAPMGMRPLVLSPEDGPWGFHCEFHPTKPWAITTGDHSIVAAWPLVHQHPLVLDLEDLPQSLAFSPDGSWLAIGCLNSIWVWPTLSEGNRTPIRALHRDQHNFEALFTNGTDLFAGVMNGRVGNGMYFKIRLSALETTSWQGVGLGGWITADPSGRFAAQDYDASYGRWSVRVFDTWNSTSFDIGDSSSPSTEGLGFLSTGELLLSHGDELSALDPVTKTRRSIGTGFSNPSLLDDRETLVWKDSSAQWWMGTLAQPRQFEIPLQIDQSLGASGDPRRHRLAVVDSDNSIRVIRLDGGPEQLLIGHAGRVYDVDFDPTGRWLASCSADGTVRLWEIGDGPSLTTLPHAELVEFLRSATSMRARLDDASPSRYVVDRGTFPGWDHPPHW